MPIKMRLVKRRTQPIVLKGKRRAVVIPKSQWKGPGLYYRYKGRWVKWSRSRDLKRGGKIGYGNYKYRHDAKHL